MALNWRRAHRATDPTAHARVGLQPGEFLFLLSRFRRHRLHRGRGQQYLWGAASLRVPFAPEQAAYKPRNSGRKRPCTSRPSSPCATTTGSGSRLSGKPCGLGSTTRRGIARSSRWTRPPTYTDQRRYSATHCFRLPGNANPNHAPNPLGSPTALLQGRALLSQTTRHAPAIDVKKEAQQCP